MTADDRPVTFDDEWERRSERLLDETDFDTELGIDLARDAQRVVEGEMSEREFHERYHGDVLEEFGQDDRELDEALADIAGERDDPEGLRDRLREVVDDEVTRRQMMKTGGVAAMGLSMVSRGDDARNDRVGEEPVAATDEEAAPTGDTPTEGDGTRLGMVINLNNCDGCLECVAACKGLHGTSRGAHWIYVMSYADPDQPDENFFVRTCMHCGDAPCEKVCPVGARHTREKDGLVLTDYDICIGCRYCMVSCPYGANYFQWGDPDTPQENENFTHDERGMWVDGPPPNGVMGKCTFEPAWQDGKMGDNLVGTTMCEQACTRDAIHFGDLNDPESAPNQHLQEYREAHPNDQSEFENRKSDTVSTFRALEERGTDPGVIFIGNEPSEDAEQVEGPVSYEEFGLVDDRKAEVLDNGEETTSGGEQA